MAKDFDYKTELVKIIGRDQEFVLGSVKVNNDTITRVSTWNNKLSIYNGSFMLGEDKQTSEVLSSIFVVVKALREDATQKILDINKELQRLAGYDVKYYKPENWRKSFDTYSINRLMETLGDYQNQLNRKKNG
jgi:hypothetical protein|nr:MAG TPA_asm: hypothetical protein [Caudoviricetes sp.]